jgi:hypothetical protein
MMMPTHVATVSGEAPGGGDAGLMHDELAADQRCSMGDGAGTSAASNRRSSSSTNLRSAQLGFLHVILSSNDDSLHSSASCT